jgi:two-component system nitrogen regulation response regulator GlnG
MSDGAMQFLSSLDFPGNVRQLENLCNWITVMAPGQTVEVKDLPQELTHGQETVAATPAAPVTPVVMQPPMAVAQPEAPNPNAVANGSAHPLAAAMPAADNGAADRANWIALLESEAAHMLADGKPEVMDALGRQFESALIKTALKHTHGRKNDAAIRLGIGRNTITRKIHELGIDGAKDE